VTDFGFGSLVGKYEEYFGRKITRFLLVVVGLGVVAAGIGATWQWLISPLLAFFNTPLWGRTLISLLWRAIGIGAGVAVGIFLMSAVTEWRKTRQIDAILAKAKGLLSETDAQSKRHRKEMDEVFAKARDQLGEGYAKIRSQTADLMEMAIASARVLAAENKGLSDAERAEAEESLRTAEEELRTFRNQGIGEPEG
jgi:hypothetical protein